MNLLIFLYLLLIAPKLLWDRARKGKRHPAFLQRMGINIPQTKGEVVWIHAISVGEVKAAQPLFRELRKQKQRAFFLITTTSATGQAEAKRSLPEADAFAYLPIDFTWVVRKWVKRLNPKIFILIESDFWWNLLAALKRSGTRVFLVSGKMSEKSAKRFRRLSFFSRKLFSRFDRICVQNEEHFHRFLPLVPDPSRLHITGNLKFDLLPQSVTFSLSLPQPVITISCTHEAEEELLLDALRDGKWFIILAPRHPERFEKVAQLLARKNIPFTRWSRPDQPTKVLLVDTMGQLPICYAHSRLAIVAGSYVDRIGGHNILEPCLYGTPVFFGPYTSRQVEFASRAVESGAGKRVPLAELKGTVETFFSHPTQEKTMKQAIHCLIQSSRGATLRTLAALTEEKKLLE